MIGDALQDRRPDSAALLDAYALSYTGTKDPRTAATSLALKARNCRSTTSSRSRAALARWLASKASKEYRSAIFPPGRQRGWRRSNERNSASGVCPGTPTPDQPPPARTRPKYSKTFTSWQLYTFAVAKRGYNRDTIRGGASDWDVSRTFSSYLRLLGRLLVHPIRFFELLPKIPDPRAPSLFLIFSSLLAALAWFFAEGVIAALAALVLSLPLSLVLAGLYHLIAYGGRYGYAVTWRILAYPFGYLLPLTAVPGLRWLAAAYAGVLLLAVGLAIVKEISFGRAFLSCLVVTSLLLLAFSPALAG